MESLLDKIDKTRIPQHVAIIMDGNGRWARQQNLPRSDGHAEGVNTVRKITEIASEVGVKYLTLYTFSTENWNRPQEEIDMLMHLMVMAIERETPDLIKNNVRLTTIGDTSRMPAAVYERLQQCIRDTSAGTGLVLNLALSYSSRWEITEACRLIARDVKEGKLQPEQVNDETVSSYLTTANMPDPDLLIRTGGEHRVSNFLLWQIAYAEIYVTDTFWPAFTKEDFVRAILDYQQRERRFGLTSAQIADGEALPTF
ncbi:MAG: isoprenyl transferase [Bacteroidales bacterium]|nr:isoprenyl transferase [Bacteroidales bacterium]